MLIIDQLVLDFGFARFWIKAIRINEGPLYRLFPQQNWHHWVWIHLTPGYCSYEVKGHFLHMHRNGPCIHLIFYSYSVPFRIPPFTHSLMCLASQIVGNFISVGAVDFRPHILNMQTCLPGGRHDLIDRERTQQPHTLQLTGERQARSFCHNPAPAEVSSLPLPAV